MHTEYMNLIHFSWINFKLNDHSQMSYFIFTPVVMVPISEN